MADRNRADEIAASIGSGEAALFTGAGFSAEATDRQGRSLPDSRAMIRELWSLLFDEPAPDDSSLADLYDVALLRAPERLQGYLRDRLQIGDSPLPPTFATWFSAPWSRIYTLNVDDLEVAVARQFALPRRLVSVSALANAPPKVPPSSLQVIHLNGMAGDDPRDVTFSTMQYAARLCSPDHAYEQLVEDLRSRPFVFVGTTLDEVVLWKHVQLERQQNGRKTPRKHSFLVSPSLTRARQVLLESVNIHWIQSTAAQFAETVLAAL
jgi:hypothetical protein